MGSCPRPSGRSGVVRAGAARRIRADDARDAAAAGPRLRRRTVVGHVDRRRRRGEAGVALGRADRRESDPAAQARAYEAAGAAAVSVLTESRHFDGSLADLRAVHLATSLPVLHKDFLVHPAQLMEARVEGRMRSC